MWRMNSKNLLLFVSVLFLAFPSPRSGADVLTQRNDNSRSGLNLTEFTLTPSSLKSPGSFGKLYFRLLDANAYAQPLYVSGLETQQGKRDVIFVATENNTVYAFEDNPNDKNINSTPLWHTNLCRGIAAEELAHDLGGEPGDFGNLTTQIGITGTPVIDRADEVLYVAAKTKSNGRYLQLLYGLDIRTGAVLRKITIEGSAAGHGIASVNGRIAFQPAVQLNRPALLLDHGTLYVAFGSHGDVGDFHGWVFAYNPTNFKLKDVFNTTPNTVGKYNGEGGIWQSGCGPSADEAGNVYISMGNGGSDGTLGDYGDSVVKLMLRRGKFSVVGYFTPTNEVILKIQDGDFGSTAPLLLPGTTLLAIATKEGKIYLLDRTTMKGATRALQEVQVAPGPHYFGPATDYGAVRYWHIHGTPLVYQTDAGRFLYVCGEEAPVRAFRLAATNSNGLLRIEPTVAVATSDERAAFPPERAVMTNPPAANPDVWMPGGFLSLSANGNAPNTAVLWALMPLDGNANSRVVHGVLRAFDPVNFVARPDGSKKMPQLWSSDHDNDQTDDSLGMYPKFSMPTIANGHVIVTTFNEEEVGTNGVHRIKPGGLPATLAVYGLRAPPPAP